MTPENSGSDTSSTAVALTGTETPVVDSAVDVASGAAAGALAGLAGAAVMEIFQTYSTSLFQPSGSNPPATEQAAQAAARLVAGARLRTADRQAGGAAVHYVVGSLTGAAYGALAETAPGVTRWRGLAFGFVCATLIDQIAAHLTGAMR